MKKILLLASIFAVSVSCTKDAPVDDSGKITNDKDGLTVIGSTADEDTRTQFENGQNGFIVKWAGSNDRIGFFAKSGGELKSSNLPYVADNSAANTTFSAEDQSAQWSDETSSHDFYAYYPYGSDAGDTPEAVSISVPAVQTQSSDGNTGHLAQLDFLYARKTGMTKPADGSVRLEFLHPLSILEFSVSAEQDITDVTALKLRCTDPDEILSAENATIDLTTGQIDYSAALTSCEITLNLTEAQSFIGGEAAKKFYAQITPGHGGKQLQVIAVSGGAEILLGTKFVPASGIPAGRKAKIPFGISSKVRLSDEGTANCYIVDKPSTEYMFKATVKGNGKPASYEWTDGEGNAMSKTISAADIAIKPKGAKLLWTTNSATNTVVTDVKYDASTGMISFRTPDSFINGNAVIAAYGNAECTGDVLWSWHIWAVENYDAQASALPVAAKSVYIMDRNVGATLAGVQTDGAQAAKTAGVSYQWGRKDPFPAPVNLTNGDGNNGGQGELTFSPDNSIAYGHMYGGADKPAREYILYQYYANNDGYQQVKAAEQFNDDIDGAIAQSVSEPWRFHTDGKAYVGSTSNMYSYDYLWGNPTGNADGGGKSIYDPCPVGWKVPSKSIFAYIANLDKNTSTYGAYFGKYYFTYTGWHMGASGFFEKCNTDGSYWTDCAGNNDGFGVRLHFSASSTYYASTIYPGHAMPVRCMSENETDMSNLVEDLSKNGTSNCYIVSEGATTYKFKATVKGNGTAPTTMPDFETEIDQSAIASVRLLWQYCASNNYGGSKSFYSSDGGMNYLVLRQSVELKNDGYIYFTTPSQLSPGNAVICACDKDGKILWTWHLWVAPGYNPEATAFSPTANNACKGITMMDRNIGAFGNGKVTSTFSQEQEANAAYGLAYQWGRKDPFFVQNIQWNYANLQAADGTISEFINIADENKVLMETDNWRDGVDYTIANPMHFIKAIGQSGVENSYKYFWGSKNSTPSSEGWNALWGNDNYAMTNTAGKKTMFDPCPQGWRVPAPNAFGFFTFHGGDMSAYYHWENPCRWNFDQSAAGLMTVADDHSVKIDPFGAGTFGFDFYTNSAQENSSVVRTDKSTNFFPALGIFNMYGNRTRDGYLVMMTNTAQAADSDEYRIAYVYNNGNVFYSTKGNGATFDCPRTAAPVRCIKE